MQGTHGRKGLESKSQLQRWRLGGPLPGQSQLTKASGKEETHSCDEPAAVLSQGIGEEEGGRGGADRAEGGGCEKAGAHLGPSSFCEGKEPLLMSFLIRGANCSLSHLSAFGA